MYNCRINNSWGLDYLFEMKFDWRGSKTIRQQKCIVSRTNQTRNIAIPKEWIIFQPLFRGDEDVCHDVTKISAVSHPKRPQRLAKMLMKLCSDKRNLVTGHATILVSHGSSTGNLTMA